MDFLENYNNGEITEFSFTPLTIELYKNGKTVSIDMAKNYKYIAIYTEHVSNTNLYKTSENVAKKIPVFIKRAKSIYDLYEKINDTCIIDVIIYSDEEFSAKEKNVIENYKKDLENRISSLKVQKGIYYSNYVKITRSKEKNENILLFNEAEAVAKTDENKFVTEVYPKIISAERDINNINYNKSKINILDKKMITEKSVQKKYSLKTEKEIVEVVDEVDKTTIEENNANIENNQNEENPETMPAEDITVTAQWSINNYTIAFVFNNGNENEVRTLNFNETIAYPENPTKEGYIFAGWSPKPETMPAEDITVTAQWIEKPFEHVEIVFDKKEMKEEEIREIIEKYTKEDFIIESIKPDEKTGEIKIVIKFDDSSKAAEFARKVNEHKRSEDTPIKRVDVVSNYNSFSTTALPSFLFSFTLVLFLTIFPN